MPIPPWRAIAIAIRDSVTVSIALDSSGTLMSRSRVSRVVVSMSAGTTSVSPGISNTSSKVSPSVANLSGTPAGVCVMDLSYGAPPHDLRCPPTAARRQLGRPASRRRVLADLTCAASAASPPVASDSVGARIGGPEPASGPRTQAARRPGVRVGRGGSRLGRVGRPVALTGGVSAGGVSTGGVSTGGVSAGGGAAGGASSASVLRRVLACSRTSAGSASSSPRWRRSARLTRRGVVDPVRE